MSSNKSITTDTSFDVIVVGTGSMGSSACYFLSKRGYKVLGIDQFDVPHEYGSHAGQSRIIRKAYFEDPGYVPLLNRAYYNWKELEEETGENVYYRTGLVYFGNPANEMMKGVKQSASLYDISVEPISGSFITGRFPQFKMPGDFEALFEPDAGFITPEKAITVYKNQAIKNGAHIHTREKLLEWRREGDGIVVTTDKNSYCSAKLVITAGAWTGKMINGLADKIKITRQFVAWIKPKPGKSFTPADFPCWMIADDLRPGAYYGFPLLSPEKLEGPAGLKLAHHYPGDITDPDNVNRDVVPGDIENLKYALDKYLPGVFESVISSTVCLYANSPDENFIIDQLPGYEDHVTIACGFSGHGFKFVSVVGEILADLVSEQKIHLPIEFLSAKRFIR